MVISPSILEQESLRKTSRLRLASLFPSPILNASDCSLSLTDIKRRKANSILISFSFILKGIWREGGILFLFFRDSSRGKGAKFDRKRRRGRRVVEEDDKILQRERQFRRCFLFAISLSLSCGLGVCLLVLRDWSGEANSSCLL